MIGTSNIKEVNYLRILLEPSKSEERTSQKILSILHKQTFLLFPKFILIHTSDLEYESLLKVDNQSKFQKCHSSNPPFEPPFSAYISET